MPISCSVLYCNFFNLIEEHHLFRVYSVFFVHVFFLEQYMPFTYQFHHTALLLRLEFFLFRSMQLVRLMFCLYIFALYDSRYVMSS